VTRHTDIIGVSHHTYFTGVTRHTDIIGVSRHTYFTGVSHDDDPAGFSRAVNAALAAPPPSAALAT